MMVDDALYARTEEHPEFRRLPEPGRRGPVEAAIRRCGPASSICPRTKSSGTSWRNGTIAKTRRPRRTGRKPSKRPVRAFGPPWRGCGPASGRLSSTGSLPGRTRGYDPAWRKRKPPPCGERIRTQRRELPRTISPGLGRDGIFGGAGRPGGVRGRSRVRVRLPAGDATSKAPDRSISSIKRTSWNAWPESGAYRDRRAPGRFRKRSGAPPARGGSPGTVYLPGRILRQPHFPPFRGKSVPGPERIFCHGGQPIQLLGFPIPGAPGIPGPRLRGSRFRDLCVPSRSLPRRTQVHRRPRHIPGLASFPPGTDTLMKRSPPA